jgi:hypothetical protein
VESVDYTAGKDPVPEQVSMQAIGSLGSGVTDLAFAEQDALQVSLVRFRPAYWASSARGPYGS